MGDLQSMSSTLEHIQPAGWHWVALGGKWLEVWIVKYKSSIPCHQLGGRMSHSSPGKSQERLSIDRKHRKSHKRKAFTSNVIWPAEALRSFSAALILPSFTITIWIASLLVLVLASWWIAFSLVVAFVYLHIQNYSILCMQVRCQGFDRQTWSYNDIREIAKKMKPT